MITKGAKVLVIAAIDGTTLADTLQKAADAGIKVFAYDRLIRESPNVDYYATFDNFKVGVAQATSIDGLPRPQERRRARSTSSCSPARRTTTTPGSSSTARCRSCSPTSTAASSSSSRVRPSSRTRSARSAGAAPAAQARMDNILVHPLRHERVDAVLSPYDGISRGIIASLKQVGYYTADQPGPVVTGQDAELPSVKSILADEQTRPCSRTPGSWPPRWPRWSTSCSRARRSR